MRRSTICSFAAAATMLVLPWAAQAQESPDHDHPVGVSCGSTYMHQASEAELLANTARLYPDTYRRIIADSKRDRLGVLGAGAEDIEWEFRVSNRQTNTYDLVTAVLVYNGQKALIWVDKVDWTNAARKNTISKFLPQLQRALDTASAATSRNPDQGVLKNDEDVFGPPPSKYAADWNYKTHFLLTDIKDAVAGGFVGGYFSPTDQFPRTDKPASNEMNMLYIDSKEGLSSITALASTIAHEYQHLIHNGHNKNSDIVFNEGASEVASILNGYMDRDNRNYLTNTNQDLFAWHHDDGGALLVDYSRAMTLVHYLTEQLGEGFLGELLKSQTKGMDRVGDAMAAIGRGSDWRGMLKGYAVANLLHTSGPYDVYKYRKSLRGGSARVARTYTGSSFFQDTSLRLEPYGTTYLQFNNPQGILKFRPSADRDYAVMAISYRGSEILVSELQNNVEQSFGEWGAFDKVVLAVTNLESSQQSVMLNAQFAILGVDDAQGTSASLQILGNTPNPAQDATTIAFALPQPGSVTLQVYNNRGELVSTLIDGRRMEAGEHRALFVADELTNGYYVARLVQDGRSVSMPIVIVK